MRASPDSFSRILENFGLLANLEPGEALDDDVLAGLGRQLGAQLLDGLAVVLVGVDVRLAQQDDLVEPLAELALRGAFAGLLGHVLHLAGGDAQLLVARVVGHLLLVDPQRACGRDVQRDVPGERGEVLVARDEVGVAVDLDEHADLAVGVDVGLDRALGGLAAGELRGAGDALLAQPGDGRVDVAPGLLEGLLAVHHPRARLVAQGLDVLGGDGLVAHFAHFASSLVFCWSLGPPVVSAGCSAGGGSAGLGSFSRAGSALPVGGASRAPSSTSDALVIGSSSAGFSGACSPGRSVSGRSLRSARWRTGGSGCGRPPAWTASATSASASWRDSPSPPETRASWRSRSACSAASLRACSSASWRARSSASRRAWSSAPFRARPSSARNVTWPSRTMSPIALVMSAHARIASSLPGTT